MKTAAQLTPEEIADYRASARRRDKQQQYRLRLREEHAWEQARRAASLLREQFGATRVMVFGSLVHEDSYTLWSDVDIAAWGIRPDSSAVNIPTGCSFNTRCPFVMEVCCE